MLLRTIWTKTLRDYSVPTLCWGIGLGALLLIQLVAFGGMSATARASEADLAQSFRFFGEPVAALTSEGYATWHILGYLPVLLGIWAVLAGARLVRGDEERGTLDVLLATPRTRANLLAEKVAALLTALVLVALLLALGLLAGEALAGLQVRPVGAALAGLNVSLGAFLFGALGLLLSQLLGSRRAAAGCAGAFMVLAYLLDGTGRVVQHADWVRRLSPMFYYGLSKPLIPTYGANGGALAVLLAVGGALALASVPLFARRDIGGTALPPLRARLQGERPETALHALERARHDVSLRTIGLRAFRSQAQAVSWWLLGLAIFTGYIILVTRNMRDQYRTIMEGNAVLAKLLAAHNLGTDAGFLAAVAFLYLPVLVAIFALSQAAHWAHDLESGRTELVLGTPRSRREVFYQRFGAALAAAVLAPLAIWLTVVATAPIAGLHLDIGHLFAACAGLLPLELVAIALVFLLAGWLRAAAVLGVATGFIALSFFTEFLKAVLDLPEWAISLSVFHQYGAPLVESPRWGAWLALSGIALVLLVAGAERFHRADIPTGA